MTRNPGVAVLDFFNPARRGSVRTPPRPPLDGLKKRLDRHRANEAARLPRDGFIRETYALPRTAARDKAREWFDRWPKQAYWTAIESWC